MPRNYEVKLKRLRHTPELVQNAVREVISEGASVRSVAP